MRPNCRLWIALLIVVLLFNLSYMIGAEHTKSAHTDYDYIAVPVQTNGTKPCAFEIWKVSEEQEDYILRINYCE